MLLRCIDVNRFSLSDGRTVSAAQLAGVAGGVALTVLLPTARCLVTDLEVDKREAALLYRTLPWMLEERLLEPVENLHVAHGPASAGRAPVCAVSCAWLRQVVEVLHTAGLAPRAMYADVLQLPWQRGRWSVFVPADASAAALVRHDVHAGFACAQGNLLLALQLLLNESREPPHSCLVIAEPGAAFEPSAKLPTLLLPRAELMRLSFWQLAAGTAAGAPPCNVLQGEFAPPLPWPRWWRQWRIAALLLLALFGGDLALTAWQGGAVRRATQANETELVSLFRSVQPEGEVVDPRAQLEQALAALGGDAHGGFLALLTRMAPALQSSHDARVQSIDYSAESGEMQIQVETLDYAAAENLRTRLLQLGLRAELLGSSSEGGGTRTRLRVGA